MSFAENRAAESRSDVSVVIPVRNGAAFVCEAIDSVLAQTGFSAEVIVVDNNSTDETSRIVAERFSSRVVLISEARPFAAAARNAGARLATRPYLAFLDADDLWATEKLAVQFAAWEREPAAELIFAHAQDFHSPELDADQRPRFPGQPAPYAMTSPSSLLLRRETFERVGDLPDVSSGEFIAWLGWARELGLRELVVPEVLVRRRIHAANSTRAANALAGYAMAAKWLLTQRRRKAAATV